MTKNYQEVYEVLEGQYDEINGYDFYRYVFPDNENQGDLRTDFSKPNAIYLYQDKKDMGTKRRLRRRIMLNDTWEEDYQTYVEENPLTLCSGLSYRQRSNKLENAQKMNALVFDLDGVGYKQIMSLFLRFDRPADTLRSLPMPTFLALSGKGLHVYYVFDKPIDLYPNIKLQLKKLKYDLTFKMWDYEATSQIKQIQYQSINQGFRMVGSVNSKYHTRVVAFQTGDRVSLDYVNQYAQEESRVDVTRPFKPTQMTRAEAKESYPEWYQRVVIDKDRNMRKWDIKGKSGYALYEWWLKQSNKIEGGHRYYYLMCLAIYACKCDVPKKKLKADMKNVFEDLKQVEHDNPLSMEDVDSALEAFNKEYYNFTINDIEKLSGVRIDRNKRNYRKQDVHLKLARGQKAILKELDELKSEGRPKGTTKEQIVKEYQEQNPTARKADCIRDTGLSKPTVYKWWR